MNKFFAISLVLLAGCAAKQPIYRAPPAPPTPFYISAAFDEAATKAQLKAGPNTLKGSALSRQKGGTVVTCAGNDVDIFPASAYAKERMKIIFGKVEGGVNSAALPLNPTFSPDVAAYKVLQKTTRCDAQGFFKFENLADGEYYVTAETIWRVANEMQGGVIAMLVSVKGGETKDIVLVY